MRKRLLTAVSVCIVSAFVAPAPAQDDGGGGGFDFEAWRRGGTGDKKLDKELTRRARDGFSDEAVKAAIQRGCDFLWNTRGGGGAWAGHGGNREYPTGPTALATYALLASGVSPREKRLAESLDWLSKNPSEKTYCLGLRCNAWYLANKETGNKYLKPFKEDLKKLLMYTQDGAYSYDVTRTRGRFDNSNSQYGVLGTWAGAMADQEIPEAYWQLILKHWIDCQNSDGGWGYTRDGSTATMTAGGIATLFVCFDQLYADQFLRCNVSSHSDRPIRAGLKWMDENFGAAVGSFQGGLMGHGDLLYFLYGVERVGLASGFKYFGTQNWYKLGAMKLLQMQAGDGSWHGKYQPVVSTSFAILFLVRGQHAIAFNKLEHEGFDWNNRPRDLAGLTHWMSDTFERTLNWQIISIKAPVEEWHDAPILYISGALDPNMSDEQADRLRTFVWQGGTILSATECAGRGFSTGIRKLYERMLPDHKLKSVPQGHPLYSIHHNMYGRPAFLEIENGIRPLVIHTDTDLPKSWQLQMKKTAPNDFRCAANALMYVTDKLQLRPRGVSHWPLKPESTPARSIKLARVKYNGAWDPEPLAYERFRRLMIDRAQVNIEVVSPVEAAALGDSDARIATMTGTGKYVLTSEEAAGIQKFVENGGTLLVDAAGGSSEFGESAELMLRAMFGRRAVRALARTAPLFNLPNLKIAEVKYRRKARVDRGLQDEPNLRGVALGERIAVVFSKEDLTGGLVGYEAYNCLGYEPETCFALVRNAVLYADSAAAKAPVAAKTPVAAGN